MLFEITPLDEKVKDEANRIKNKDPGFMAGSPAAVELSPQAPKLILVGEGNTVPPYLPSVNELVATKKAEADKEIAARSDRLADATKTVNGLFDSQTKLGKDLDVLDKITNTDIKSIVGDGIGGVDLTGSITPDKFHWGKGKYPNPANYGLGISDVVDLQHVDMSGWNLPKPKLGQKNDNCYTLDDIMGDTCGDLDHYDARQDPLPTLNYSNSKFDSFPFPSGIDRTKVPMRVVADVSDIELCSALGLMNLSWPDFDLPDIGNPFSAIDLSGVMDTISGFLGSMSMDGDLLNLSAFSGVINGIKCVGAVIADVLVPDAIADALSNFTMPGMDDSEDAVSEGVGSLINNALYLVSDDWIWADKAAGIYNYDTLSKVSPIIIKAMSTNPNNQEIANLAAALRKHRTQA